MRARKTTTGPADPFTAATSDEFLRWSQQRVRWWRRGQWEALRNAAHPHPDAPKGLPAGWDSVATHATDHATADEVVWCLVRRQAGGWLLVSHHSRAQHTELVVAQESIGDLYAVTVRGRDRIDFHAEVVDWLKVVISAMFDPNDPAEAAEQVLFALSDQIRTPPRSTT